MKNSGTNQRIDQLWEQLRRKSISRREFVRYAALLGIQAASPMHGIFFPKRAFARIPRRGGVLKIASPIRKITHPARLERREPSNILSHVAEYLTYTDARKITHPRLLESWSASDDLKTWTLNLRKGVRFNNGDEFTADDVIFTFRQWLEKDVNSSMRSLVGKYLSDSGLERVGKHLVRLHLTKPELAVPEHLFHYPAVILNHRTFEGDFMKAPHGTGPFTLEVYRAGETCRLKRRAGYWRWGVDGLPLPYLDGAEFIDFGDDVSSATASLRSGGVAMLGPGAYSDFLTGYTELKHDPRFTVRSIRTANTSVLRMRVDVKPWTDNRIRMALKLCQHREKILALNYFGRGLAGHDFHVCPVHPEYCEKPVPEYEPEKARRLLQRAGYPAGLSVVLAVSADSHDDLRYARILKQDAMRGGFNILIDTMTHTQYWNNWKKPALGITLWYSRPLGTMALNLGYTSDENGEPAVWNETRWVDPEFDRLLEEANGTLNIAKRRKIFCELERIQWERGSIGVACWKFISLIASKKVRGVEPHPTGHLSLNRAWLSDDWR